MMVILSLTFILLEHFLSFKNGNLFIEIDAIRSYEILLEILTVYCLFSPFKKNKKYSLQSRPFQYAASQICNF